MQIRKLLAVPAAGLAALGLGMADTGQATAADNFYKGKNVTVIVGYSPGGGYDTYSRLLADHMEDYLPGEPTLIVKNMPGAGSLTAANYIAVRAPKDGTVFGTFTRSLPLFELLKTKEIPFDPFTMTWLGSLSSFENDAYMLLMHKRSPFDTVEDLKDPDKRTATVGATAPGSTGHDVPHILKETLGLDLKVIAGYPGSAEGALAVDRGEVDGRAQGLSSIRATQSHWIDKNEVNFMLQFGRRTRHPEFPDLPTARELAPNDEALAIIKLQETPLFMARPYAAPPDLPAERAKVLRKAFLDTAADPEFKSEAKKLGIDVSPIDGEKVTSILNDLKATPPEVFARYKQIIAAMPELPVVTHEGEVTKTKRDGRRVFIMHEGEEVKTKVSGSRTDVFIDGDKTKRKFIKAGMTCAITYTGPGAEAKKIECQQ